ncbi:hypothetical protein [Bacillus sp. JJ722]|uniref:hypothetical protein n=1 Tax=Bacillus sp. JJ722 TaxID=3122973 RepID=UPI002FFE2D29
MGSKTVRNLILIGAAFGKSVNINTQNVGDIMLSGAGKPSFTYKFNSHEEMILLTSGYTHVANHHFL